MTVLVFLGPVRVNLVGHAPTFVQPRSRAGESGGKPDRSFLGEQDGHRGAGAHFTFNDQFSAVQFSQLLAQRQAKAGTILFAGQGTVHLTEIGKRRFNILGRDAYS